MPNDKGWHKVGNGNFDGAFGDEQVWTDDAGHSAVDSGNGNGVPGPHTSFFPTVQSGWELKAVGDFGGDGISDLLWFNEDTRDVTVWEVQNNQVTASYHFGQVESGWHIAGVADVNPQVDTHDDIVWQHDNGTTVAWLMGDGFIQQSVVLDHW